MSKRNHNGDPPVIVTGLARNTSFPSSNGGSQTSSPSIDSPPPDWQGAGGAVGMERPKDLKITIPPPPSNAELRRFEEKVANGGRARSGSGPDMNPQHRLSPKDMRMLPRRERRAHGSSPYGLRPSPLTPVSSELADPFEALKFEGQARVGAAGKRPVPTAAAPPPPPRAGAIGYTDAPSRAPAAPGQPQARFSIHTCVLAPSITPLFTPAGAVLAPRRNAAARRPLLSSHLHSRLCAHLCSHLCSHLLLR